jgi:ferritin
MLTLLAISRHTPGLCAFYNEKSANIYAEFMRKQKELEAKHGVKMVGGWNVSSEHLTVQVFEAPTFEAFQAYSMEPEVMKLSSVDTTEIKMAVTLEEAGQMMMQMMQAQ